MSTLTPIRRCFVRRATGVAHLVAITQDGRRLRHIGTDWDDERHPQQIANVISMRGRIFEHYWVPDEKSAA